MPVPADPAARQPTIEFVANGRAAGTDGCNRVSAPYTLNGERITFGPMIATRMACPGADEVDAALRGGPGGHHRVAHRRRAARVLRRDRQAAGDLRGAASGRDAAERPAGRLGGAARVEGVRLDVAPGRPDPERRAPHGPRRSDRDGGPAARARDDARRRQGQRRGGAAPAGRSADRQGGRGRGLARRHDAEGRPRLDPLLRRRRGHRACATSARRRRPITSSTSRRRRRPSRSWLAAALSRAAAGRPLARSAATRRAGRAAAPSREPAAVWRPRSHARRDRRYAVRATGIGSAAGRPAGSGCTSGAIAWARISRLSTSRGPGRLK